MRDKLVDALKGYACFLVVFGHVIMGIRKCGIDIPYVMQIVEEVIWTFHVALFMFLSGYVYHVTGEWKSKKTRVLFIKHKLINLAIPYFVFSVVYIFINVFFGGSDVNNAMSLSKVLWLWREPVAQYWFLYDLFFIFVAFTVLSKWLANWQITLGLTGIYVIASVVGIEVPMPFAAMIRMVLPFGVGACMDKLYIDKKAISTKCICILIHLAVALVVVYLSLDKYVILDMFIPIIGCIASVALISFLVENEHVNKLLLFICQYSFPIYLLHTIFTAGIRVVLLKVGIEHYGVHVLLGSIFGFCFPIVGAILGSKMDIFNFFFYPEKILKKWKEKRIQRV